MDEVQRRSIEALHDIPEGSDQADDGLGINDILDGSTPLDLSHAGGEFSQLLEEDLRTEKKTRVDPRTRRDRLERRTQGFNAQMPAIIEAYLLWSETVEKNGLDGEYGKPAEELVEGKYSVDVLDVFRELIPIGLEALAYLS
jgi:hypothetical protein